MFNAVNRNRGLRSALLLGAASTAILIAVPAIAQDESVETVVVTGSRIPQVGLYSSSPVTAVGQQEFKLQGATNVESLLRQLPSTLADADNQTVNNGSAGEENIDLRGLGNQRTLVLVDGKRLMPADNLEEIDLSVIPAALVDHIEVLTGGSSAVYGADAVAGVVNVILRKDFEGMEIDGQYQTTSHSDGTVDDLSVLMGMNSDNGKGNITIYGGYTNRGEVLQANRKVSAFALHDGYVEPCIGGPKYNPDGSINPGTTATFFGGFCRAGSSIIAEGLDANTGLMFTPDRTLVPYDGLTFNFAPYNYFQTPDTRYTFGAEGHYEVSKQLDIYTRLTFANHGATTQLAPTPILAPINVNFGNPLLSDQERSVLFGPGPHASDDTASLFLLRRLVENGNRVTDFNYSAYQMVIGARGDLGDGWTYDVSAQYGHTLNTQHLTGDASAARFQQGLLVNPDGTCVDPSGGCVPIDIFAAGAITPTMKDFFTLSMDAIQQTDEWDIVGSLEGNLGSWGIRSPWAKTPVGVAVGSEYRREASRFEPDDNLATGNLLGFGQEPAVGGSYNVTEGFGELRVPLVEDQPFFKSLQVDGAYRYSSYNLEGVTNTYKLGAQWSPTDDFMLRASFQRAVRAPNVSELFSPVSVSQNGGIDPCSAAGLSLSYRATSALCVATGVPAGSVFQTTLNCPSNQCTSVVGGNQNLKPETSDTRSIGLVFTPTFFDGFTATVDYFDIKVEGAVGPFGGTLSSLVQACYDPAFNPSQDPGTAFCRAMHRDSQGRIFSNSLSGGNVLQSNFNTALLATKGVDFELNYQKDMADFGWSGIGSFAANLIGTWTRSFQLQGAPVQPVNECAGLFGDICGAPLPKWRHNLRVTWYSADNDVSLSILWRHMSGVEFDEVKLTGFFDPPSARIPAYDYFDLAGTWEVTPSFELRAGVNNIFEKDPPPVDLGLAAPNLDSGNTFPGTYDVLGRTYFIGGTVKF